MAKKSAKELLAQIAADEAAAYAEFESKQKERREKALAALIDPLKKERIEVQKAWNEASLRLTEIDKEIASITGTKVKTSGGKGTGSRVRWTQEQKLEVAEAMYNEMAKSRKNEFAAKELQRHIPSSAPSSMTPAKFIEVWNSVNGKEKGISNNGKEKGQSRFFVH